MTEDMTIHDNEWKRMDVLPENSSTRNYEICQEYRFGFRSIEDARFFNDRFHIYDPDAFRRGDDASYNVCEDNDRVKTIVWRYKNFPNF